MDGRAVKEFVNDNPDGVEIRMVDGTVYRIAHRDFIWFTPAYGKAESRVGRLATSFYIHDAEREENKLINALLVKELSPLHKNGNGHAKAGKAKKKG